MNLVVKSAAVFLFVVAAVGGLSIWILKRPAGVAGKWAPLQRAVPQVVGKSGKGTGFVTEIGGTLWLVTNYHVLDGHAEVKAIFRDVPTGEPEFEFNLKTAKAKVHPDFIPSWDSDDSGASYDLAAFDIEIWRPQIKNLGIEPLAIADRESLNVDDAVAALGHPKSDFGGGDDKDEDAENTLTHSFVDGTISAVRTEANRPCRVQHNAAITHGYSGGPLVLKDSGKVAAVNTWKDVDEEGRSVDGLFFSLAADQVNTIVEQGVLLSSIHDRIVASGKKELPTGEELPEKQWSRWEWLEDAFEARTSEGWQWGDRAIRKTNSSGLDEMAWKVPGEGPQHVAVLILPESPLVDLDVERLGSSAGEAGQDDESWAGGTTFLPFHDAKSGQLLAFAPGETVTATISAWFLGEPIEARYLILWMHSPAEGGSATSGSGSSSGSSGGGSSSPPPPPQPPPGSGTAPQPAAQSAKLWQRGVPWLQPVYPGLEGKAPWHGSGFVLDIGGTWHLVTNQHVVASSPALEAIFYDESPEKKEFVRLPPIARERFRFHWRWTPSPPGNNFDVAVASLTPAEVATLQAAHAHAFRVGQPAQMPETDRVVVIGHPAMIEYRNSTVSGTLVAYRVIDGFRQVQTDAATHGGNSGGPVIEASSGEAIAIHAARGMKGDKEIAAAALAVSIEHAIEAAQNGKAPYPRISASIPKTSWERWPNAPWIFVDIDDSQDQGLAVASQSTVAVRSQVTGSNPGTALGQIRDLAKGAATSLSLFAREPSPDRELLAVVVAPDGSVLFERLGNPVFLPVKDLPPTARLFVRVADTVAEQFVDSECLILVLEEMRP